MTADHCPECPFIGCHDCRYQGGTDPTKPFARQAFQGVSRYTEGAANAAAPAGNRGLTTETVGSQDGYQ